MSPHLSRNFCRPSLRRPLVRLSFHLVLLLSMLLLPVAASAQIDSNGNDFILGFLRNIITPSVELHLTSSANMQAQVEYPVGTNFGPPVTLTPGSVSVVTLPSTAAQGWTNGAPQLNAVRAYSVNPSQQFTAYLINRATAKRRFREPRVHRLG